jgi:hypothetical protein
MRTIRAAIAIVAIAGGIALGPATAANAASHSKHIGIVGRATGTDTVTFDSSCADYHVVGSGTLKQRGEVDTYEFDGCATDRTSRNGTIFYELLGSYTLHTPSGETVDGQIHGSSRLTKQKTLAHRFDVTITGGTGKYANASGNVHVAGSGTYDYTNGITISDTLRVNGRLKLAS